jgi:hypothetical protein
VPLENRPYFFEFLHSVSGIQIEWYHPGTHEPKQPTINLTDSMEVIMKRILKAGFIATLVFAMGILLSDQAAAQTKGTGNGPRSVNFVDNDGDGICDNFGTNAGQRQRLGAQNGMRGKGYGPGDGTGNKGVGPKDGTGFGAGKGTGTCDGTGPKGYRGGRK